MTRDYFIKRAKELYGDLYSYDKVGEITNNKETVTITCKKHGDFGRIICNFLNGRGCSLCSKEKRTEENKYKIIERCSKVHNNRYDYSKVSFTKQRDKVCIICPEHGEFWQSMDAHLRGEQCPECAKENSIKKKAKTSKQFINEAIKVHGDKYDYSKVEYINDRTEVCIICPEHGEFWQKPNSHLQGSNCPKCAGNAKKTTEDFIKQVQKKFGDIYDFSKTEYNGLHKPVTVIYNGKEITTEAVRFLTSKTPITFERVRCQEDFIEKAKKVHCNKYDYSKVEYINNVTPVCIICPEHGEFWQKPAIHLQGSGCKECKISSLEERMMLKLKENNIQFEHIYRPEWLSSGLSHQSIDLYLPEYNVGIECQGGQHFRNVPLFRDNVESNIERDIRKYNKCNDRLKLLYLVDKHIKKKDIIDNEKYGNIYTKDNTFKQFDLIIEHIKQHNTLCTNQTTESQI